MDLKKFQFPEVSDVHLAFPTFDAIPELVEEAYESRAQAALKEHL